MINEGARCLEEAVVPEAAKIDLAMVFGAGFPPFRGGLLRYADAFGLARASSGSPRCAPRSGDRFEPAALLSRLAAQGGRFTTPAD